MKIEIFVLTLIIFLVIIYFSKFNNSLDTFSKFNNSLDTFSNIYEITKIDPVVNLNSQAEIAFVYVFTSNIYNYCQHSIVNLISYATKYNYGVVIYNNIFNNNVSPCWNKIAAILENLSKYKYLIWIDADAIINNFDIKIESWIQQYPLAHLLICLDIQVQKECVNSGVMIVKNTPWSFNLFNLVWNSNIPHGHNDQNVILYQIIKDLYPDSSPSLKYSEYCLNFSHPNVQILPENAFNSNIQNYIRGDFIIHLMGVSAKSRINIMRQINTKLGLDDYTNTDCIDLINGYNELDRVQMIRTICLKQ